MLLKRATPIEGRSNSRLANVQQLQRFVERDVEPVELSDTVLGRTLINEVETESLQNAFNIPDDLTESTENPASSAHESELDEVSRPAMSTRMPRLRRPPEEWNK